MVKAKHSGVDQKSTATKVPRERKEERHRRYIPSVSFVRKHQLLKNTESAKASNEATGFYPFLCDSCCPKTSSLTSLVQTSLETRAHASSDKKQSMEGHVSNVFIRWDIFQVQSKLF